MTTLKIFTILIIFALVSCQSSSGTAEKTISRAVDTTKPFVEAKPKNSSDTSFASYLATLKNGIEKINATINDSTIFTATKGQLFIYENYSENAWIADGRSAYIPRDQIVKVDTPYFKFNFSKWDFIKDKDYELAIAAKRKSIELNSLIHKIRLKDPKALREFLHLENGIDGAAAEEYYYDFWAFINLWNDDELRNFISSLSLPDALEFSDILINRTPFGNITEYYQRYYPKTLNKIKTL
jgi:hypothetical protein